MSDVNHEDINLAATYASWNHTRCCCRTTYKQTKCAKCRPTTQICCLSGVHSACGFPIKFVRSSRTPGVPVITVSDEPGDAQWVPGDLCDDLGPTNLCGHVTAYYGEGARCGPPMQLFWEVNSDCTAVVMRLSHGSMTTPSQTLPRDWFTGPVTFEDPVSRYYHNADPDNYPTVHTVTITGCVEPVELYGPSQGCGPDTIYIRAYMERSPTGSGTDWGPYNYYAKGKGSCCCGQGINCVSDGGASSPYRGYVTWGLSLYTCKIVLSVSAGGGTAIVYVDGDCVTDPLPLTVPVLGFEDTLRWKIEVADECEHGTDPGDPDPPPPDPPPPPPDPPEEPCTSGCWPPCVMCPTRKTLYAVIDGAPTCCVAGTYALSWVSTGGSEFPLAGYYELPSPVGGPIDTCGVIDLLRVSCVDLTHIQVQLVYRQAEGTEISNLSSPLTLSVACDVDGMESEPFNIPGRSGDRESLCGFGSGVGGNLRIVSA